MVQLADYFDAGLLLLSAVDAFATVFNHVDLDDAYSKLTLTVQISTI
jgi:hypothetical protein